MTSKERVKKLFDNERPDRIPVYDMVESGIDPQCEFDIELLDCACVEPYAREDKFNMVSLMDPFEDVSNAFGLENFLTKIGEDPEAVSGELHKSAFKTMKRVEEAIKGTKKIDGIWLWSDMAYNKGTFFSEKFYTQYLLPLHKNMCSFFSGYGLPVVIHSDGNLNGVIQHFIEAGFRGLHPLESAAGMDIVRLKDMFGDKLVFFGNVPLDILRNNDRDAICSVLKNKLEFVRDNARYVFGFESPITGDIDLEKYRGIIEFVKDHGRY